MHKFLLADFHVMQTEPALMVLVLAWFIWYANYRKRMVYPAWDFSQRYMYGARVICAFVTVAFCGFTYSGLVEKYHEATNQQNNRFAVDSSIPGDIYIVGLVSDPKTFATSRFTDAIADRRQLLAAGDLSPDSLSDMEDQSADTPDVTAGVFLTLYCTPLANHGYAFQHPELRDLFSHCAWYHPAVSTTAEADGRFNPYEQRNSALLLKSIQKISPDSGTAWANRL